MMDGIIIALAAGIDQVLKYWIEGQEAEDFPRDLEKSGGKIRLYRNHNAGFPFGFLQKYEEAVRTIPLVVTSMLGGVLCYLAARKEKMAHRIALAVVIGGSVSNLYDRFVRRYVVDYFSVQIGVLKKVVFNLGDICVFAGSGMLLVLEMFGQVREHAGAAQTAMKKGAQAVMDRKNDD